MASKKKKHSLAQQQDRHRLYELSVQCAESEIDFVDQTFQQLRGRKARLLREDFCGTANVCCEWVKRRKKNRAIGVDLDGEVLAWGRQHNLSRLKPSEVERIELLQENVLEVSTPPLDIVSAMNFSYWLLQDRSQLKQYLQGVHGTLKEDGILFMDAYGGYESFQEIEEERDIENGDLRFTYHWEQASFNPIDHQLTCHIHFSFEDGSRLDRAFSYTWRLWTLPEIRDLLQEVGFSKVTVYWQGWDKHGEPDGDFKPATRGEPDAGWIVYITAEK